MFYHDGYHFWGMHFFWWIVWLAAIFLIFGRHWFNPENKKKKDEEPMEILKKRYASGEISTEEFEERKKVLEDNK